MHPRDRVHFCAARGEFAPGQPWPMFRRLGGLIRQEQDQPALDTASACSADPARPTACEESHGSSHSIAAGTCSEDSRIPRAWLGRARPACARPPRGQLPDVGHLTVERELRKVARMLCAPPELVRDEFPGGAEELVVRPLPYRAEGGRQGVEGVVAEPPRHWAEGVQQSQERHLVALRFELLRHLEGHHSSCA